MERKSCLEGKFLFRQIVVIIVIGDKTINDSPLGQLRNWFIRSIWRVAHGARVQHGEPRRHPKAGFSPGQGGTPRSAENKRGQMSLDTRAHRDKCHIRARRGWTGSKDVVSFRENSPIIPIKPNILRPGDTVALISPASPIPTDGRTVDNIVASVTDRLASVGLHAVVGPHAKDATGYLAGSDTARAQDLMDAFADPDVDGIWCMNGGYGTPRLLDRLDYGIIAQNPKVFIGFSDITALHTALRQRSRLVTFLGPLGYELAFPFRAAHPAASAFSWEWLLRAVMQPEPLGELPVQAPWQTEPVQCIVPGVVRAPLVGGNLSLLSATMGTPYEIDTTDKILLIEDVNEAPYRIDRMLTQLRLAGKLQAAAGFIFGECVNCGPTSPTPGNFTLRQIVNDIVAPLGKPTVYGLASGHGPGQLTLPLGVTATVDGDRCRVIIDESGVTADRSRKASSHR